MGRRSFIVRWALAGVSNAFFYRGQWLAVLTLIELASPYVKGRSWDEDSN